MWSDRQTRNHLITVAVLLLGGILAVCWLEEFTGRMPAWVQLVIVAFPTVALEIGYHRRQFQRLEALTESLRKACSGQSWQDLRDNEEGQWSVLCSELYKVTRKLQDRGTFYQEDQQRMADAIADISHQLKTPLTSMTLMTDLLQEESLSPAQRAVFVRQISQQLTRLEWLVSSLLKLSRLDAGTAVFDRQPVPVEQLVREAAESLLVAMDVKDQKLVIQHGCCEDQKSGESQQREDSAAVAQPVLLECDRSWTVEAFLNVMKNCVEHTPEGGAICVSWSENPLYVEIAISDTGVGIAKEDLPYIFQRFYRGKNAEKDSVGIGLALAESIVRRQQGQLTVASTEGQGSCFTFRFYKMVI